MIYLSCMILGLTCITAAYGFEMLGLEKCILNF